MLGPITSCNLNGMFAYWNNGGGADGDVTDVTVIRVIKCIGP